MLGMNEGAVLPQHLGSRNRWISEPKVSLVSIVSCRIASATQQNPALKNGEREKQERQRQADRETESES